jgi:hypothetical protein
LCLFALRRGQDATPVSLEPPRGRAGSLAGAALKTNPIVGITTNSPGGN